MSEKGDKGDDAAPKGCIVSEEEMAFYKKLFPTFDIITKRKIHCTVCRGHLGCAPGKENEIKMHPVLRVMQCTDCHEFYSSGEFSRGEDGSELYCRWCGQGGQVYCCSSCPYVFCKSCIVENLNKGVVRDIEENDSWNCFSCSTKIIWPLRAMHWALTKYIAKEKEAILNGNHTPAQIQELLTQDNSTCCKTRTTLNKTSALSATQKRRATQSPQGALQPIKKTRSNLPTPKVVGATSVLSNNSLDHSAPPPLVMQSHQVSTIPMNKPQQYRIPASIKQTVRPGAPILARPTTLNRATTSVQSRMTAPRTSTAGTSLGGGATTIRLSNNQIISNQGPVPRRQVSTITATTTNTSGPVYHTINGYRIDLNSASKQDNFRLPNGKLIQVKRQVPVNQSGSQTVPAQTPASTIITTPTTTFTTMNQYIRPPIRNQAGSQHIIIHRPPPPPTSTQQYIIHTPPLQQHSAMQQPPQTIQYRSIPQLQPATTTAQTPIPPGVIGQQNIALKSIPTFVKHIFASSPLGVARNTLQSQLFHTMEICHHLMTKTHTLTNSNAYKTVHNLVDIKELYIHLSYLLTYAIGRFKGLQEKCLNDMVELGFTQEAKNLEKGQLAKDNLTNQTDDDLAIVEPQRDTIELDSDVEDDIPRIKIEKQDKQIMDAGIDSLHMTAATGYGTSDEEIDLNVAADLLAGMLEVELTEGDPSELRPPTKGKLPRTKTTKRKQRPNSPTTQAERAKIRALQNVKDTDPKLKMDCKIILEKLEIPQIESKDMDKEIEIEKESSTETKESLEKIPEKMEIVEEPAKTELNESVTESGSETVGKEKVIEVVDSGDDDKNEKEEPKKTVQTLEDSDKMSVIDLDDDEEDKTEEKKTEKSDETTNSKAAIESEVINLDDDDDNVEKTKSAEKPIEKESAEVINLDDDDDEVDKDIVVASESSEKINEIGETESDQITIVTEDTDKNPQTNEISNVEENSTLVEESAPMVAVEKSLDDIFEISEDEDENISNRRNLDKEKTENDDHDILKEEKEKIKEKPEVEENYTSKDEEKVETSEEKRISDSIELVESSANNIEAVPSSEDKIGEVESIEDKTEVMEVQNEDNIEALEPAEESSEVVENIQLSEDKTEVAEPREDKIEDAEISEDKEVEEGEGEGPVEENNELKEEVISSESEKKEGVKEDLIENNCIAEDDIVLGKNESNDIKSPINEDVEEEEKAEKESINNIYRSPIKATEDSNGKVYVDGKPLEDKDFESSSSSSSEDEDEDTRKTQDDIETKDLDNKESQSNGFSSENNSSNYDLIESMIKENLSMSTSDKSKIEENSNGLLTTTATKEV